MCTTKLAIFGAVCADRAQLWAAILADVVSLVLVLLNGTRPLSFFPNDSPAVDDASVGGEVAAASPEEAA